MAQNRTFTTVTLVLVTAILTLPGLSLAKGEETRAENVMNTFLRDQLPPEPLEALAATPCVAGDAGGYPCDNVDLLSFMPLADIGGGSGNDIWGWTGCGGREFALMGRTTGTAFVDITDPENPIYLGNLPTHTSSSSWRDIKTYADHAFIVSEAGGHGMQVFDLSQLCSVPSPPATFSNTTHYNGFGSAHNIVINEDTGFAYGVGADCSGGLHMVDISTPAAPTGAGCFSADGYTHDAQCVIYSGPDADHSGQEICFNSNEDTLTIVDVTNKAAPVQLSRTGYSGSAYTHQGWVTDDHAHYLMNDELDEQNNGHNTRTRIWNVTDLDAPVLIGFSDGVTTAIDHNLYVKGSRVYEANYRAGLRILDASDVANGNLVEDAFFDIYPSSDSASFNGAWSVYPYFSSGVVVVSGIEQGLFVLQPRLGPDFTLDVSPDQIDICAPDSVQTTVDLDALDGFDQPVNLVATNLPLGVDASFSPATVTPDGQSTLTLDVDPGTAGGASITVTGTSGLISHEGTVDLSIASVVSAAPVLTEPENGRLVASLLPTLRWDPSVGATSFSIEIDDDPTFSSPHEVAEVGGSEYVLLSALLGNTTYYWRVWAINPCGDSQMSVVFSFTTTVGSCAVFSSVDVPITISESGTPTVTSTLDVVQDGLISDLDVVSLSGVHTWINDLDFTLISPLGTEVQVMARSCASEDDFDLGLDDEAAPGAWPCPPTGGGVYQPSNPLAVFDGEPADGDWTLQVVDNVGSDGGQLLSWGLSICSLEPVPGADLMIAGNASHGPILAGSSLSYLIEVTNNGPDMATDVTVSASFPSEVAFVTSNGCIEDPNGMPVCSVGFLGSGSTAQITFNASVVVGALGSVTSDFEVDFPGDDSNLANDHLSVDIRVEDPATVIFVDGFETGSSSQW